MSNVEGASWSVAKGLLTDLVSGGDSYKLDAKQTTSCGLSVISSKYSQIIHSPINCFTLGGLKGGWGHFHRINHIKAEESEMQTAGGSVLNRKNKDVIIFYNG